MRREEGLAIAQWFRNAGGRRDLAQMADLYADDAVALSPIFGEVRGRAAILETWRTMFTTFADLNLDIADVLVDGDRLAILGHVRTTDRLGWFGLLPPTGSPIEYRIVLLLTFRDGKIVRDERIYDSAAVIERLEKARLDKELRTAADVQRALLSRTAHVARFCEVVGHSIPCRAIGGDFFEFAELPSGAVAVAMGDVSGKGPAAALLASLLQGMIAIEAPVGSSPSAAVSRLNQRLVARQLDARFVTLVYGILGPNGAFRYTNAGHNAPALVSRKGIRRLATGGPILGTFARASYEEEAISLDAGDTVVMFTDGVSEARNAAGEEFGEERLMTTLESTASAAPAVLLNRIFAAVREFSRDAEQNDDVTVAVTRVLQAAPTAS